MSEVPPMPVEAYMVDPPMSEEEWQSLLDRMEAEIVDTDTMPEVVGGDLADGLFVDAPFKIVDERTATWAMGKLAEHEAECERLLAEQNAYLLQLNQWHATRSRRPAAGAAYLRAQLEHWARNQRLENPKGPKSWPLPTGKVATRESKASAVVMDEAAAIQWVKDNLPVQVAKALVRVKESMLVSELREHVKVAETVIESEVELECGHCVELAHEGRVGESVMCEDCDPPEMRLIAEHLGGLVGLAVVDAAGNAVAGCRVEPGRISVSIKPKGATT